MHRFSFVKILYMQGHMWRTGFLSNDLVGFVFDDVSEALDRWHAAGIKVCAFQM